MSKTKTSHRLIAITLLTIFFPSLLPINMLHANNNGPTAPEATSFEPVDAPDMVNLVTGDMSYVLPLLNIPSPEGGYPMSISNHAGIAIDQEASWVGLGWSLNPGAINRSVSGVPDDWKRASITNIFYQAGGESRSYSASVSVGWSKNFSAGLYGSYSENKTVGGTSTYSFDGGATANVNGVGVSIGSDGFGVNYGWKGSSSGMGYNIGINQSFKNGSTTFSSSISGDVSYESQKTCQTVGATSGGLGLSFNTKSGASASMAGGTMGIGGSTSSGRTSVRGDGYGFNIPIYCVNVGFSYTKIKYWNYETNFTQYEGALYAGDIKNYLDTNNFDYKVSFDSYNSLYSLNKETENNGDNLSFVSYDRYSASGQGMSGVFSPSIYEPGALRNNFVSPNGTGIMTKYLEAPNSRFTKTVDNNTNDIHFYFDSEASSYLRVPSTDWIVASSGTAIADITPPNVKLQYANQTSTTINSQTYNGYNFSNKRKRTGSCIETFTNQELIASEDANQSLVIKPENYNRTDMQHLPLDGIGAFRITAVDGKVYHYSIPVYQQERFSVNGDLQTPIANRYNENIQYIPYATHWLLTAITGPDYVDTNGDFKVDKDDYGYWVSFDYGKWSDGFVWGAQPKASDKTIFSEWGVKEIYYLDKVSTRTHSAYFIKSPREDDKSFVYQIGNGFGNLEESNDFEMNWDVGDDGGLYFNGIFNNAIPVDNGYRKAFAKYAQYQKYTSHKSLKLEKIILVKNDEVLPADITKTTAGSPVSTFYGHIALVDKVFTYVDPATGQPADSHDWAFPQHTNAWSGEFYSKVYDMSDLKAPFEQKAIKIIKFSYRNSNLLAKNSANSTALQQGRLTLDKIDFLGKSGTKVMPPYKFDYYNSVENSQLKEDDWGYYKDRPYEWSLKQITTPTGAIMNINYESDDINAEAVSGMRGFDANLEFVATMIPIDPNHVYINVFNQYSSSGVSLINFQDFFQTGPVSLDFWSSLTHEYNWPNCDTRKGAINVLPTDAIEIVNVVPQGITVKVPTYLHTLYVENDGLSHLFNKVLRYDNINVPDQHMRLVSTKRNVFSQLSGGCDGNNDIVLFYKLLGNKNSFSAADKKGGGIRVKEVSISDGAQITSRTKYFYNVPGSSENPTNVNYVSSGITSFVPHKYFKNIKYMSELPPPMVMYKNVTVKKYASDLKLGNTEEYTFETLTPDISTSSDELIIPGILEITKPQTLVQNNINTFYSRFNINDMTSSLGRLNSKKVYNSSGQLIQQIDNTYKATNELQQGISEESFNIYKRMNINGLDWYRLGTTSKTKYPSIVAKTTTTEGGYSVSNYFDFADFLTGEVTQSRSERSDGKVVTKRTVPAYYKSQYAGMGPKCDNLNNKNMLSQTAMEFTYLGNSLNDPAPKLGGVGITTWSNDWEYEYVSGLPQTQPTKGPAVWRNHKTYVWNGSKDSDGLALNYVNNTDDGFDWTIGVGQPLTSNWKQLSETTKYNHFSAPIEIKDANGNFAATKMGDKNSKVMASGAAKSLELFYSGAEYDDYGTSYIDQGVILANAQRVPGLKHTGNFSVETTSASKFGVFLKDMTYRGGMYKLSVWIHKENAASACVRIGNSAPIAFNGESYTAGDWILKNHYFNTKNLSPNVDIFVNSMNAVNVYYDDLMVRPINASMSGYVYNKYDELTAIIGTNGLATKFSYDAMGRLTETYVEVIDTPGMTGGFKLNSSNTITYKNLP